MFSGQVKCPFLDGFFLGSSSVAKVTLHNRSREVATFEVSPVVNGAPFKGYHKVVQVKAKHYLSIPMRYSPTEHGVHVADLKLKNIANGHVFVARLIGKTRI